MCIRYCAPPPLCSRLSMAALVSSPPLRSTASAPTIGPYACTSMAVEVSRGLPRLSTYRRLVTPSNVFDDSVSSAGSLSQSR